MGGEGRVSRHLKDLMKSRLNDYDGMEFSSYINIGSLWL